MAVSPQYKAALKDILLLKGVSWKGSGKDIEEDSLSIKTASWNNLLRIDRFGRSVYFGKNKETFTFAKNY